MEIDLKINENLSKPPIVSKFEKACNNCKYMLWMVGVGQGVKCRNDKNKVDGKLYNIPSRRHVCEYFKAKKS